MTSYLHSKTIWRYWNELYVLLDGILIVGLYQLLEHR